jgi:ribosomal protein L11 methylase PrmA
VRALDVDPVAVEVTLETARRNRVDVDVLRADAVRDELPPADVLVANIELGVVEAVLARGPLARFAVTSGYVAGAAPRVPGWRVVETLELEGWGAHVLAAQGH